MSQTNYDKTNPITRYVISEDPPNDLFARKSLTIRRLQFAEFDSPQHEDHEREIEAVKSLDEPRVNIRDHYNHSKLGHILNHIEYYDGSRFIPPPNAEEIVFGPEFLQEVYNLDGLIGPLTLEGPDLDEFKALQIRRDCVSPVKENTIYEVTEPTKESPVVLTINRIHLFAPRDLISPTPVLPGESSLFSFSLNNELARDPEHGVVRLTDFFTTSTKTHDYLCEEYSAARASRTAQAWDGAADEVSARLLQILHNRPTWEQVNGIIRRAGSGGIEHKILQ